MPEQDGTRTGLAFITTRELPAPSLGGFLLACVVRDLFATAAGSQAPQRAPRRSGTLCHTTFRLAAPPAILRLGLTIKQHHLGRASPALADAALWNAPEKG